MSSPAPPDRTPKHQPQPPTLPYESTDDFRLRRRWFIPTGEHRQAAAFIIWMLAMLTIAIILLFLITALRPT